jgi:succinate dehydrogenase/fumarate reductase flavoprotein subunit
LQAKDIMPLKVGIIGAGIGGLSAAIGLRRAGAEVEVRIYPFPCIRSHSLDYFSCCGS